jgi:hypothetical protein
MLAVSGNTINFQAAFSTPNNTKQTNESMVVLSLNTFINYAKLKFSL